ncbi:MAG: hypothetical protein ACK5YR_08880, partial [Pirellula sp.]
RTPAITQPEQLTQRKSERLIEGLACIALFSNVFSVRHGSPSDPCTIVLFHSTSSVDSLQS